MLLHITAPHFCAGVVVGERAAPIINYMNSWSEEKIRVYCSKKGWEVFPEKEEKEHEMDQQTLPQMEAPVLDQDFDSLEIPEFLKRVEAGEEGEEVSVQLGEDFEAEVAGSEEIVN